MAKLPSIKRIVREDIPNAPQWIESLIYPLNRFMEEVYYALDRDLTIGENLKGSIRTVNFKTRNDYSTASPKEDGWEVKKINDPLNGIKPDVILVGKITNRDNFSDVITEPVTVFWDFFDNEVTLKYITGLADDTRYEVKLLIF